MHCIPTVTSSPLNMADHIEVTSLLVVMSRDDIMQLGSALGLSFFNLIKMDHTLEGMIAAWLSHADAVLETSGPSSWTSLATALDKIGHSGIATKIRKGTFLNLV